MKFEELNIIEPILKAIKEKGYTEATPIQQKAIPILLEWKDLIGCAQTWTWKTASFAIPTLQLLSKEKKMWTLKRWISALIITPTRELAIQINDNFTLYWKNTKLKNTVIFWWVKQGSQVKTLATWIDILVATPGRLLDLMGQWIISLKNLKFFTLDEADRMLDMWFIHDIKKIIKALPEKRQSMFFSATMPDPILNLSKTLLKNPEKVEVTPVSSTAETVSQKLYMVEKSDKKNLLNHILKDKEISSLLVFSRTKHWANKIVQILEKSWTTAQAIHWNKSQNARQNALKNFKNKETRVLVATDIAARWIDIDKLSYVLNYDIPNEPETYVHRIWRTWRAKRSWLAMSFCEKDEMPYLKDIHKLINKEIPVEKEHPYHILHSFTWKNNLAKKEEKKTFFKKNNSRNFWKSRR